MLKVIIVEDELPARRKLRNYIGKLDIKMEIERELESVEEVLDHAKFFAHIDLILSDIELRDGNVLDAYKQLDIKVPIIFITAYNQFWMDAFEMTGIEYLLKPYTFDRFEKSVGKYIALKDALGVNQEAQLLKKLDHFLHEKQATPISIFPESIAIKNNTYIYFLSIADIVFIRAEEGVIFAYDCHDKRHILSQTSLKLVAELLNPNSFYKVNRSEIINKTYIEKLSRYSKNSLAISFKPIDTVLKTSQKKTVAFKDWLGV